jgi:hypothetical protein
MRMQTHDLKTVQVDFWNRTANSEMLSKRRQKMYFKMVWKGGHVLRRHRSQNRFRTRIQFYKIIDKISK